MLEIDALDYKFGSTWASLSTVATFAPIDILHHIENTELNEIFKIWQDAFEWTYYDTALFSKFYLHRDQGFKRLYTTLLLFFIGINFIVLAGNFETIFVGWELLGITSFLLIAFYRDRFLPVKNALKVVSLYRLGDISMLIAIWLCHYLLHQNISFDKLINLQYVHGMLHHNYTWAIVISCLFVLSASIKSAQFPFSSWLPRAMEGPTTTSAIFYGSLSVHIGVFLLLRTYPFWESMFMVKSLIVTIGVITLLMASAMAYVQPTVKTQIAYSSIAQIGIIFIEVALGFHTLALIHFAGNAFLRTYQLLVSPSVLSYLIHEQFYSFVPKAHKVRSKFWGKFSNTFYTLSIKEFNLDFLQYRYMWTPFKWIGGQLVFLNRKMFIFILGTFYLLGIVYYIAEGHQNSLFYHFLTISYAIIGAILVLKAFTDRQNAKRAWSMIAVSQLFVALTISLNEEVAFNQIAIFLSGTLVSAIVGYYCLHKIDSVENSVSLNNFHGHAYEHPKYTLVFLVAALGLAGFPFTPTFLGIDLIFSHIHPNQLFLIVFTSITFIFSEIAVLRIYARVFLGPHVKTYHEIAYRSS